MEKVRNDSEHVNMILRYVPYVQTNFVLDSTGTKGQNPLRLRRALWT